MAQLIKYKCSYNDVEGRSYELLIYEEDYAGQQIDVDMYAVLDYGVSDSVLELIRPSTLTIMLNASVTQDFSDLKSDNEKSHQVILLREAQQVWVGWITPDGFYRDWVNERWQLQIVCIDGLDSLQNLAYVQDTGLPFAGQATLINIMANALKRTGSSLNIRVLLQDGVFPVKAQTSGADQSLLLNKVQNETFIEDDGESITSCWDVLLNVLRLANCTLFQQGGYWYMINLPAFVLNNQGGASIFQQWNSSGTTANNTSPIEMNYVIGSHINNFPLFHVNENQRLETKGILSADRVEWIYGQLISGVANPNFYNDGTTIANWTINEPTNVQPQNPQGVKLIRTLAFDQPVLDPILTADTTATVFAGQQARITVKWRSLVTWGMGVFFRLYLNASPKDWYLSVSGLTWVENDSDSRTLFRSDANVEDGLVVFNWTTPMIPDDGVLILELLEPFTPIDTTAEKSIIVEQFAIGETETSASQGITFTATRNSAPSSISSEPFSALLCDGDGSPYEGSLFLNDGLTRALAYRSALTTNYRRVWQATLEDTLSILGVVSELFTGDVYGFIPYFSRVEIDGIEGVFHIIGYKFDTYNNIITLTLYQLWEAPLVLIDITFETVNNYGSTTRPTIKG